MYKFVWQTDRQKLKPQNGLHREQFSGVDSELHTNCGQNSQLIMDTENCPLKVPEFLSWRAPPIPVRKKFCLETPVLPTLSEIEIEGRCTNILRLGFVNN